MQKIVPHSFVLTKVLVLTLQRQIISKKTETHEVHNTDASRDAGDEHLVGEWPLVRCPRCGGKI